MSQLREKLVMRYVQALQPYAPRGFRDSRVVCVYGRRSKLVSGNLPELFLSYSSQLVVYSGNLAHLRMYGSNTHHVSNGVLMEASGVVPRSRTIFRPHP